MAKLTRFRVTKDRNYTTIHNQIFRNRDLSLKAKGFFATVMTLPDSWDFTVQGMTLILKESKHAIYSAISELENAGYVKRVEIREKGRFKEAAYEFTEVITGLSPYPGFSDTVFSDTDYSDANNRPQINKKEIKYLINQVSKEEIRANARSSADAEAVQEVFSYWQETLNYPLRKLNSDRREKIKARLRSFTATQLKRAIDGAARDSFLNGDNPRGKKYTDIGTIFKNDSKVEDLMDTAVHGEPRPNGPADVKEWMEYYDANKDAVDGGVPYWRSK